ncbi:hypothetical protein [Aestuariivivens sediminicola]|uniref:hypothetical protein n=1 Tax=Aestuariivivens sediminicola TaxID=2913560 RepID=UPI001F59038A|nr:hypothetical protein [Aestuariivivens sediminicola]
MKKEHGAPHLTNEGFSTYWNIIILETRIKTLNDLKRKFQTRMYDPIIIGENQKLKSLTNNKSPEDLLKDLIKVSVV